MTAYDTLSSVATRQLDRIRALEAEVAQFRTEPWIKLRAERDALNEQVVRLAKEYETQVALAGQRADERDALKVECEREWLAKKNAEKERDALKAELAGVRLGRDDERRQWEARVAELERWGRALYDCYNGAVDNRTPRMDAIFRGGGRESGVSRRAEGTTETRLRPSAAANSAAFCELCGGEGHWQRECPFERDDVRECEG